VLSVSFTILAQAIDLVLDRLHLLLRLLAGNFLAHFDCFDFGLRLGFNPGLLPNSVRLLFLHLLLLFGDLQHRLRLLYLNVVLLELLRDGGLGHADRNDLDTRRPFHRVYLKDLLQVLIKLVKLVDVDLVECVSRAELVDLVMNFVVDPSAVIVDRVVLDSVPYLVTTKSVHHLDFLEMDDDATLSSAWYVVDGIRLYSDLHCIE